jgi:succinate dehydrogenase/fumarate reductase flavoprotein subunit
MVYNPVLGGYVPLHDRNMETSVPGVYVAGDVSGVEEASAAMEEGRIAGISVAQSLNLICSADAQRMRGEAWARLDEIRSGLFGTNLRRAKDLIVERRDVSGVS